MIKPQKVVSKVKKITWLNHKILELELEYITPEVLTFLPGQYISMLVAPSTYRRYSIASSSLVRSGMKIVVSAAHEGIGADYIKSLRENDEVIFVGAGGRFVLVLPPAFNLYLFGTGTGVAPFITFLYFLKSIYYTGKIELFFGNRNESEVFYLDLLESFKDILNLSYTVAISNELTNPQFVKGRVTQFVSQNLNRNGHFYLCGNPNMILEMKEKLFALGVEPSHIFIEEFTWAETVAI